MNRRKLLTALVLIPATVVAIPRTVTYYKTNNKHEYEPFDEIKAKKEYYYKKYLEAIRGV